MPWLKGAGAVLHRSRHPNWAIHCWSWPERLFTRGTSAGTERASLDRPKRDIPEISVYSHSHVSLALVDWLLGRWCSSTTRGLPLGLLQAMGCQIHLGVSLQGLHRLDFFHPSAQKCLRWSLEGKAKRIKGLCWLQKYLGRSWISTPFQSTITITVHNIEYYLEAILNVCCFWWCFQRL